MMAIVTMLVAPVTGLGQCGGSRRADSRGQSSRSAPAWLGALGFPAAARAQHPSPGRGPGSCWPETVWGVRIGGAPRGGGLPCRSGPAPRPRTGCQGTGGSPALWAPAPPGALLTEVPRKGRPGGRERSLGPCPGLSPCPTPRPPAQPRSPYCCGDKLLPQAATAISLRPAPQPSPTLPSRAAPPPRGWEPGRAGAPRWVLVPGTWLEGPAWRTSGEARGRPAPQQ